MYAVFAVGLAACTIYLAEIAATPMQFVPVFLLPFASAFFGRLAWIEYKRSRKKG